MNIMLCICDACDKKALATASMIRHNQLTASHHATKLLACRRATACDHARQPFNVYSNRALTTQTAPVSEH